MKINEILKEGSDRSLLYHSTILPRAQKIVDGDNFAAAVSDAGRTLKRDSYISFSRSPSNQYVKVQSNLLITFEIDEEKLRTHLIKQRRGFSLDPFVFGNTGSAAGNKNYVREYETRLNLLGREAIPNIKKFVRAVHIFTPVSIKDRAAVPTAEKPPMVGGLSSEFDPDWKQKQDGFKSPLDISREQENQLNQLIGKLEKQGIRVHLYLNRKDFLSKAVHKSVRPKGNGIIKAIKALIAVGTRGKVKLR